MIKLSEKDLSILTELTELIGPVGREDNIQKYLSNKFSELGLTIEHDAIGNLFASMNGNDEVITLTAHADEIGYIVSNIDDDGIISIHYNTGAANPDTRFLVGKDVIILGEDNKEVSGVIGFLSGHLADFEVKKEITNIYDIFIDTGLPKKELSDKGITIGSPVVLESKLKVFGLNIKAKALDDRIGLFILIKLVEKLSKIEKDKRKTIKIISTVQEEIGIKGALAAVMHTNTPVIAIDIGPAGGYPEGDDKTNVRLGKGPVFVYKDFMIHYNHSWIKELEKLCITKNIPFQRAIYKNYGSDGAAFITSGMKTVLIAIPTKYTHSPIEIVNLKDVDDTINLLEQICLIESDSK